MNRKIVARRRRDYYRISIRHQQRKTFQLDEGKLSLSLSLAFFPLLTRSASDRVSSSTLLHDVTRGTIVRSRYVSISNHTGGPMEKFNWRPRNSQSNSSQTLCKRSTCRKKITSASPSSSLPSPPLPPRNALAESRGRVSRVGCPG